MVKKGMAAGRKLYDTILPKEGDGIIPGTRTAETVARMLLAHPNCRIECVAERDDIIKESVLCGVVVHNMQRGSDAGLHGHAMPNPVVHHSGDLVEVDRDFDIALRELSRALGYEKESSNAIKFASEEEREQAILDIATRIQELLDNFRTNVQEMLDMKPPQYWYMPVRVISADSRLIKMVEWGQSMLQWMCSAYDRFVMPVGLARMDASVMSKTQLDAWLNSMCVMNKSAHDHLEQNMEAIGSMLLLPGGEESEDSLVSKILHVVCRDMVCLKVQALNRRLSYYAPCVARAGVEYLQLWMERNMMMPCTYDVEKVISYSSERMLQILSGLVVVSSSSSSSAPEHDGYRQCEQMYRRYHRLFFVQGYLRTICCGSIVDDPWTAGSWGEFLEGRIAHLQQDVICIIRNGMMYGASCMVALQRGKQLIGSMCVARVKNGAMEEDACAWACVTTGAFVDFVLWQLNVWTFSCTEAVLDLCKETLERVAGSEAAEQLILLVHDAPQAYAMEARQICKSLSMHWALWMSVVLKSPAVIVPEEPAQEKEEWQTNHSLREKLLGIDAAQMVAALQAYPHLPSNNAAAAEPVPPNVRRSLSFSSPAFQSASQVLAVQQQQQEQNQDGAAAAWPIPPPLPLPSTEINTPEEMQERLRALGIVPSVPQSSPVNLRHILSYSKDAYEFVGLPEPAVAQRAWKDMRMLLEMQEPEAAQLLVPSTRTLMQSLLGSGNRFNGTCFTIMEDEYKALDGFFRRIATLACQSASLSLRVLEPVLEELREDLMYKHSIPRSKQPSAVEEAQDNSATRKSARVVKRRKLED